MKTYKKENLRKREKAKIHESKQRNFTSQD